LFCPFAASYFGLLFRNDRDVFCVKLASRLLLNELSRSPTQVVTAIISLLKLALALDTGSYFASQTDIILYVLRLGVRVVRAVLFVAKALLYRLPSPTATSSLIIIISHHRSPS
jgi:hypothetical protein